MRHLRYILGDQLSRDISSLRGLDPDTDVVLMAEVAEEAGYVRHHQQKIAFLFSAMRHFAEDLARRGVRVEYTKLDDPGNAGSFTGELERALRRHAIDHVVVTEPGEWRVLEAMRGWQERFDIPVHIRSDDRFFCSHDEFRAWAGDKRGFRMEFFYRAMRRKTGLLMEGGDPVGGQWNFDKDNRKSLPATLAPPPRLRFEPDAVTAEVLDLVRHRFGTNFGDLAPFGWATTRPEALLAFDHFILDCLPHFGDYQDAMRTDDGFLFHSLVSPYLNAGLLGPNEVCQRAQDAYEAGIAPLNAVEGFIRQILGWREYVRGVYWLKMPDYAATNALNAHRKLPALYWTGETDMNCLRQAVGDTRRQAYAHHIQRLMITGNFALLAGIEPAEVEEWYLAVYADAYEWVELPNVHGMVLFADGGLMGSKPYAAGGAYINRMTDYCGACTYDPAVRSGPTACPFTTLYWAFLIDNADKLSGNRRLAMPYRAIEKLGPEHRAALQAEARRFLDALPTDY